VFAFEATPSGSRVTTTHRSASAGSSEGDVETVWRAHHEPVLLQQWLLGPQGWTMPVCEVAKPTATSGRRSTARMTDGMESSYARLESLIS
jgi:hypothetical protein